MKLFDVAVLRSLGRSEKGTVRSPQDTSGADPPASSTRSHVLTVSIEDYYHAGPFRRWIPHDTWYRFEARLVRGTESALELLARHDTRATFFVPGYLADTMPELVRGIVAAGHELGSSGYSHRGPWDLGPEAFREEVQQARERLEAVSGTRVLGFRAPQRWLEPGDFWVLEALAEAGYLYDSSVRPRFRTFASDSWRQQLLPLGLSGRPFFEVPVSSLEFCGLSLPVAGGGALRHLPASLIRTAVSRWDRSRPGPYVMYFRTWELDPDQPRMTVAPALARYRQYRNLERMSALLDEHLGRYRFTSIAGHYGLTVRTWNRQAAPRAVPAVDSRALAPPPGPAALRSGRRVPATVVTPCYNETNALPYLRNTLQSVAATYRNVFDFSFIFVDDCSTDGTWEMLQDLFGGRDDCQLIRHERNLGVAAAIQTGIRRSGTDIVCSIDCDCTYDPHELGRMIPLLGDGVDVVTASPYHPAGAVRNVPGWRLVLSKTLSRAYRLVLHQKLFTYTSCFRVYRRQSAAAVDLQRAGFLGVAEMIARLDLAGRRVVEYPTTLHVRVLGQSKMKVLRTAVGHAGLLLDVARARVSGWANTPGMTP